jgi:hypothetical protein
VLEIGGINEDGESLNAEMIGDYTDLNLTVYYAPRALANIVCFNDLKDKCEVNYNSHDDFFHVVTQAGNQFIFKATEKFYICDLDSGSNSFESHVLVSKSQTHLPGVNSTVKANEFAFTKS